MELGKASQGRGAAPSVTATGSLSPALHVVLRGTGADHAVQIGAAAPTMGLLPVPGQGPTLVWRDVNDTAMPPADRWDLSLGDIELF